MVQMTLSFAAVNEPRPGKKWAARCERSWPAYEAWFLSRGGDAGPSRTACRAALERYMPELVPTYDKLVVLAGGSDRAARFLSTWCPPAYLGGCSIAAVSDDQDVRLVRNYDLSPDLNEGLLLRTEWTGRAVMGMVEFLWGLSDGINEAGLSIALAFGGRSETGSGFGITTILRYVLETCDTVEEALATLRRVPSHMAYNLVLADAAGRTAGVEMAPGGGMRVMPRAIGTNHQSCGATADRPAFTRTLERHAHLTTLRSAPLELHRAFLAAPLLQDRYRDGFGTLFTAEYDPKARTLGLTIDGARWDNDLAAFVEGRREADYSNREAAGACSPGFVPEGDFDWSRAAAINWRQLAMDYAAGQGREIEAYLPRARLPEEKEAA